MSKAATIALLINPGFSNAKTATTIGMKKRGPEGPGDARSASKIIYIAYCKRIDDLKSRDTATSILNYSHIFLRDLRLCVS
jgi:hypothetical protein